jgi:O-antigen/teichoic acid export membrane protein
LVAVYGWIGAAVATTVSAAVALVLGYLYLQSLLTVRVPIGELARQAAAAGGMALVVAAARQPLPTTWQAGFGLALTGGVVYFGLLFGLSARFRRTIGDNLPLV